MTSIELKKGKIYSCIGKGGRYELLGSSIGAGKRAGELLVIYRDTESGQLYHREMVDFAIRMELLEEAA